MKKFWKKIRHFLTPEESNNYKAKVLHPSFLLVFIGVFLFCQAAISFIALSRPGVLGYSSEITPEKIIDLTNKEREKKGLTILKMNNLLNEAAQQKAGDMFAFDYWAHKSPSGREPWSFFKAVGYEYRVAGENLARDFSEPEAVVKAWMESPSHRDNILNFKYREVGVAVVEGTLGGIKTTLVVQFFGTPANFTIEKAKESEETAGASASAMMDVFANAKKTLAFPEEGRKLIINPMLATKTLSQFFFGFIAGVLLLDGYLVVKSKVYRSSGKVTAHTGFLAVMFLLVLLSQQGVIK